MAAGGARKESTVHLQLQSFQLRCQGGCRGLGAGKKNMMIPLGIRATVQMNLFSCAR